MSARKLLLLIITIPGALIASAAVAIPDFSYKAPEVSLSPEPLTAPTNGNKPHSAPALPWQLNEPKAKIRLESECNAASCSPSQRTYQNQNHNQRQSQNQSQKRLNKMQRMRQNDEFSADHNREDGRLGIVIDFNQ